MELPTDGPCPCALSIIPAFQNIKVQKGFALVDFPLFILLLSKKNN